MHEFAITVLNGITAFARVGFESVEVEFEGVSAGLLHFAGIANPSAGRRAVQAGDHGNGDGLFCPMDQLQVTLRSGIVGLEVGKIGDSLGEFIGTAREVLIDLDALERELLFEK